MPIRNGIDLDYCWREAIQSMLPFCDQVCVCDAESTDGTREELEEWKKREPKLKVVDMKWPDPVGNPQFYPEWLNVPIKALDTEHACYLDADEVFDPSGYDRIREAAERGEALYCKRLNFWRDAQSLIPEGKCCGTKVIRVGKQSLFFPSDYPDRRAGDIQSTAKQSDVLIFHYGFLRRRDAFFKKAKAVQRIWAGSYDPRLAAAEQQLGNWMTFHEVSEWVATLPQFKGTHPEVAHEWLKTRGFWVNTEDLLAKWKTVVDSGDHIWTWTEKEILSYLAEEASKSKHGLEYGVYMGRSAHAMLKAAPMLHLWAAETFWVAGTQKTTEYFLRDEIAQGRCEIIPKTSPEVALQLEHMKGKLDFCWIDAGHRYEDVKTDIVSLFPLLKIGGVMLGHDLDTNPDNEVSQAVRRFLPGFTEPIHRLWRYDKTCEIDFSTR